MRVRVWAIGYENSEIDALASLDVRLTVMLDYFDQTRKRSRQHVTDNRHRLRVRVR